MGMYTELHFNAELKADVPESVVDVLKYMVRDLADTPATLPDHEFFATRRWRIMCVDDSGYFPADTYSTIRFSDIADAWFLCIRSNSKNYDNEIGLFLDWIMPYVYSTDGTCLGYWRYEECEEPTIIYYKESE